MSTVYTNIIQHYLIQQFSVSWALKCTMTGGMGGGGWLGGGGGGGEEWSGENVRGVKRWPKMVQHSTVRVGIKTRLQGPCSCLTRKHAHAR